MANSTRIPVNEIIKEIDRWVAGLAEEVAAEIVLEAKANAAFAFEDSIAPLKPRPASKNKKGQLSQGARFRGKQRLRKSIMVAKRKDGTVVAGVFAPHAHLVEFGHVIANKAGKTVEHVPAKPFFMPAIHTVENRLPEIVADVKNGITITVKQ